MQKLMLVAIIVVFLGLIPAAPSSASVLHACEEVCSTSSCSTSCFIDFGGWISVKTCAWWDPDCHGLQEGDNLASLQACELPPLDLTESHDETTPPTIEPPQ